MAKSKAIVEFGDFQTPLLLAEASIQAIGPLDAYQKIIEPTCGVGTFLCALQNLGLELSKLEGWEINPDYVKQANQALNSSEILETPVVKEQDFFDVDWSTSKHTNGVSTLFIGNPPWVTNSELGKLSSKNLPKKSNLQNLAGLDALTGKSNFDLSEFMLTRLLEFISATSSSLAFLIKTSVARKLFQYISKKQLKVSQISIRGIDAKKHFNVYVDACLFQASGSSIPIEKYQCPVYENLEDETPQTTIGMVHEKLVSDVAAYQRLSHIDQGSEFKWRSGIKHDAAEVMEFDYDEGGLSNGHASLQGLPFDFLYPMYKSSHISKLEIAPPKKYMLVTQKKLGDETKTIEHESPKTWNYLIQCSKKLDARKSSIYKNAPRFSIFGVGDYTFMPWKIVISGLYKNLVFSKIGSFEDKPIVIDDTCYMLGFSLEKQADFILQLLSSPICRDFIQSIIFLDNKRPITVALLNRINTQAIAKELGLSDEYQRLFPL